MNWYKKAQYSIEDYEAHPIPSTTDRSGPGIKSTYDAKEPLPDTPKIKKKKRKQPKEKHKAPFSRSMPYK